MLFWIRRVDVSSESPPWIFLTSLVFMHTYNEILTISMSSIMSPTLNPNLRMTQIGIRCSRANTYSQRYHIGCFCQGFCSCIQPSEIPLEIPPELPAEILSNNTCRTTFRNTDWTTSRNTFRNISRNTSRNTSRIICRNTYRNAYRNTYRMTPKQNDPQQRNSI